MAPGLCSTGLVVVVRRLSCPAACGTPLDWKSSLCSPHQQADSQPLDYQGSAQESVLRQYKHCLSVQVSLRMTWMLEKWWWQEQGSWKPTGRGLAGRVGWRGAIPCHLLGSWTECPVWSCRRGGGHSLPLFQAEAPAWWLTSQYTCTDPSPEGK